MPSWFEKSKLICQISEQARAPGPQIPTKDKYFYENAPPEIVSTNCMSVSDINYNIGL